MSMSERTPLLPTILQQQPSLRPSRPYESHPSEHTACTSPSRSRSFQYASQPALFSRNDDKPRDIAVRRDSSVRRDSEMAAYVREDLRSTMSVDGAADEAAGRLIDVQEDGTDEMDHLLSRPPFVQRVKDFFVEEVVSDSYATGQLLVYTFATGIIDLTTLVSYGCFASKQTGNTVFLAMRLAQHPYIDEEQVNIYFSFGFFLTGLIAFAHVINYLTSNRPLMRLALFLSALLQAALVLIATLLVICISEGDDWPVSAIIMALLALQAGGQINLSAQLGQSELNTTMITGVLLQVCRDPQILKWENRARNRRCLYWLSFMLGCFTGSALSKYVPATWGFGVHGGFKTVLALSFLWNKGKSREQEEEANGGKSVWSTLCGVLCLEDV